MSNVICFIITKHQLQVNNKSSALLNMAQAQETDLWRKFDLFSDQKLFKSLENEFVKETDMFLDSFHATDKSIVPDISDQVLEFNPVSEIFSADNLSQFDCDELLLSLTSNTCDKGQELDLKCGKSHIIDMDMEPDAPDPLRHDCMWSGVCPSEEHRNSPKSSLRNSPIGDIVSSSEKHCSSLSSLSASCNSVFDTPLQSDFETSDIDESLGDSDQCRLTPDIDQDVATEKITSAAATLQVLNISL